MRARLTRGFTLVEMLIVVVILGIIAAIVVPTFSNAATESSQSAFVNSLMTFAKAAYYYEAKTGKFPPDGGSGNCPAELEPYLDENKWNQATPIGGVWDSELNSFGFTSALGVHFWGGGVVHPGDAYMQAVDALCDDGELDTGAFRKIAHDRYYLIIQP